MLTILFLAKDIITKMLTVDPASRITAKEALKHSWFKVRVFLIS